jgi:hypothetical protein
LAGETHCRGAGCGRKVFAGVKVNRRKTASSRIIPNFAG